MGAGRARGLGPNFLGPRFGTPMVWQKRVSSLLGHIIASRELTVHCVHATKTNPATHQQQARWSVNRAPLTTPCCPPTSFPPLTLAVGMKSMTTVWV